MQQRLFYVYEHRRADTGEIFYVGQGSLTRTKTFRNGRTQEYLNYIKALDALNVQVEVVILYEGYSKALADKIETKHIKKNIGRLLNRVVVQTVKGLAWTKEQKQAARKPKPPGFAERASERLKGKKLPEAHKAAISAGNKGKKRSPDACEVVRTRMQARWNDPKAKAEMLAQRRTPEARHAQSLRIKQWWNNRRQKSCTR